METRLNRETFLKLFKRVSLADMAQLLFALHGRGKVKSSLHFFRTSAFQTSKKHRGMIDGDALSVFGHLGDAAVDSWEH